MGTRGEMPADEDPADDWEANAAAWLAWARTTGHDVYYDELNLPAFAALLPAAGSRTLDVGCGEGRLGRYLGARGHRVAGLDRSATLVDAAREAGGYDELVCGDAVALPWDAGTFDLAVAFMSLHDMADPAAVIGEVARVLGPGGALCLAIVHPLNRSDAGLRDYFTPTMEREQVTRRGLTMTFAGVQRPLEVYTRALRRVGFVIEELREPRATAAAVARAPSLEAALHRPYFLHLRCRRQ